MIISDKDAVARLSSPGNLINKLRSNGSATNGRTAAMNLFVPNRTEKKEIVNPFAESFNDPRDATQSAPQVNQDNTQLVPFANNGSKEIKSSDDKPQVEDLIDNSDQQIALATAHNTALKVMNDALSELSMKLPDMKADKLPSAIAVTSKVVESIRRERREAGRAKNEGIHLHIYAPQQNPIEQYSVIDVG